MLPLPPIPELESLALAELTSTTGVLKLQPPGEAPGTNCALRVLSTYDEGPDLVLYYKYLMVQEGNAAYEHQINDQDVLSASQREFVRTQLQLFKSWWSQWPGRGSEDLRK